MTFSLEQVRVLHAVVRAGSFSAAARKMGKAQSAISTTIANLEIDLGLQLFDRTGHTPELTAAGKRILDESQHVLGTCENLARIAGELTAGVEPVLTLAVDDDAQLSWLTALLGVFSEKFPTVEVELLFPLMEDLCDMLMSGRAHLGIGYQLTEFPAEFMRTALTKISFPVVVSSSHPLAQRNATTLNDLQQFRQVMVTNRRKGVERERFRLSPTVWWVEGDQGVLDVVKQGLGWAAVPSYLLRECVADGTVVELPIDLPFVGSELGLELLRHRARSLGLAGQWLHDQVVHFWQIKD